MNEPLRTIEAGDFLGSLRDRSAKGVYSISLEGGELPVSVQLRDTPSVVFTFTGAIRRDGPPLPRFATGSLNRYVRASIIRLADPSLALSDELRLAWYAGHEGFELQKLLPDLLHQMIDSLDANRAAFIGVSGGGFASLYYSWKTPGSVAIALNPQTNLNRYRGGLLKQRYCQTCWPALDEQMLLDTVIDANLCPLYKERCANTAIILQSATDYGHLTSHLAPFVAALPSIHRERLIVRVASWGVKGHVPAPANAWIPWVAAALSAADTNASSIEAAWGEQNPFRPTPLNKISPTAGRDERIAAELAHAAIGSLLGQSSPEERPS